MNTTMRNALAAGFTITAQAEAQVTFYEYESLQGQSFTANQQIDNFAQNGFNDRASSVVVMSNRWEVCKDAQIGGRCVVLLPPLPVTGCYGLERPRIISTQGEPE